MKDLMFPLCDINRPEYLLIEISGFLISEIEILFQTIRLRFRDKFPKIAQYDEVDYDEFYRNFSFFSPYEFVKLLSPEDLSDEEIYTFVDSVLANREFHELIHATNFSLTIPTIANAQFCRKVYLISDRELSDGDRRYIAAICKDVHDKSKLEFYVGSTTALVKEHPEISSIFTNHIDTVFTMLHDKDTYPLHRVMIVLRASTDNITIQVGADDSVSIERQYDDELAKLTLDRTCEVSQMAIDCIPIDELNPDSHSVG